MGITIHGVSLTSCVTPIFYVNYTKRMGYVWYTALRFIFIPFVVIGMILPERVNRYFNLSNIYLGDVKSILMV